MAKYRVSELMTMKGAAEREHNRLNNLKPDERDKSLMTMLINADEVEYTDEVIQAYIEILDELIGQATVNF